MDKKRKTKKELFAEQVMLFEKAESWAEFQCMRMCHGFPAKPKLIDTFWYANLKKTSKTFKKILEMGPYITFMLFGLTFMMNGILSLCGVKCHGMIQAISSVSVTLLQLVMLYIDSAVFDIHITSIRQNVDAVMKSISN